MKKTLTFIAFLLLPLLVGGISGFFTAEGVNTWYNTLVRPSFNPPGWVFGPVWTTLYILMGISSWRIFRLEPSRERTAALGIYFLQLVLNFCWSFIFFRYHFLSAALVEIVVLWCCILWMISRFYRLDRSAAIMNIPYLAWVSFATALNAAYALLN